MRSESPVFRLEVFPMRAAESFDRRGFLKVAGLAAAATGLNSWSAGAATAQETPKLMKKAVKWGMIQLDGSVLDKFKLLKQLGFDGVELDAPSMLNKDEVLKARDET